MCVCVCVRERERERERGRQTDRQRETDTERYISIFTRVCVQIPMATNTTLFSLRLSLSSFPFFFPVALSLVGC